MVRCPLLATSLLPRSAFKAEVIESINHYRHLQKQTEKSAASFSLHAHFVGRMTVFWEEATWVHVTAGGAV